MSDDLIILSGEARAEYMKLVQKEDDLVSDPTQAHKVNSLLQRCISWGYFPAWKEDFEQMYKKYQ